MPEEFEVPSPHEQHIEHTTHHAHAQGDSFASKIAVMTAIMATVGALMSYQAGSTENEAAMDKNNAAIQKTEAANEWSYYQAKSSGRTCRIWQAISQGWIPPIMLLRRGGTGNRRRRRARRLKHSNNGQGSGTRSQSRRCISITAGPRQ